MLDFAQIRTGKFRKDISRFDIREAIGEIVNVQALKAEYEGINLGYKVENFEAGNFVISSDMLRIQQVLLNLQSNALKFTPSGGQVQITCRMVRNVDDLKHFEHHQFF
jgi:signal transduction histidine kinase